VFANAVGVLHCRRYLFDLSLNISNPANFGVISTELIPANGPQGSRWIEPGLRLSF
jgi:hypothetical protein